MELRPYQQDIIANLNKVFIEGFKSPVIVLPCGGGKSVVCADIAKTATDKGENVLFLVHRIELIEQIQGTFTNYGVDLTKCDIKMVQSSRELTKEYDLIITDESHHCNCRTYQNVYRKQPNALRVNVTATPCRTDGRGLGETCDYMMETVSVKWLIDNHYLAPFEYYTPKIVDIANLQKVRGEYIDQTMIFDRPKVYGDIFKYYQVGKKAICYCASVRHSIKMAEEFNKRGIPAKHIDGAISKIERKQIIDDFRTGKVMVLCNYGLIAEGFDVPDCDMVLLVRKTASLNLFIQMVMRCMRYKKDKTAIILDFCGNCYEHGLPDDERKWSLDKKVRVKTNESSEPEIIARTCNNCFKTYSGQARICPYCGFDNGKTRREIEQEQKIELARITQIEKEEKIAERKKAQTFEELVALGKERGYKNPAFWAMKVMQGRRHR